MYFEDAQVGRVTDLGSASFTRDSILAYARQFDPRVLLRADVGSPLAALRAAMAARGEITPELGVSPGFLEMRRPHAVLEGDVVSFSTEIVSKRETSKPNWGLVVNSLRGINQRGESVISFSGAVLAIRRTAEK